MLTFDSMCSHVCQVTSVVSNFATLWTVTHQAPLSMGFSRQEYWIGLSFSSPGDLSNRDRTQVSRIGRWIFLSFFFFFFTTEPPGKSIKIGESNSKD